MVPVFVTELPTLLAVWVTAPIVVVPKTLASLILLTDNEAAAPVALRAAEEPAPDSDATVMLPLLVMVPAVALLPTPPLDEPFVATCVMFPNSTIGSDPAESVPATLLYDAEATAPEALIDTDDPIPDKVSTAIELPVFVIVVSAVVALLAVWLMVPNTIGVGPPSPAHELPTILPLTEAKAPVALIDTAVPVPDKSPAVKALGALVIRPVFFEVWVIVPLVEPVTATS